MALTLKQWRFVVCWIANGGNGRDAAEEAGYQGDDHTLRSIASENLKKPAIREAVEDLTRSAALPAEQVLQLLSEQATATLEDFVDTRPKQLQGERIKLDLGKAHARGKLHLLKGLKYDKNGHPEVLLHDAQAAAVQLGRYHGLFTDKVIHATQAEEFAGSLVDLVVVVLRTHLGEGEQLEAIVDDLESRMAARLSGGSDAAAATTSGPVLGVPEGA